jgi:hypothetical protein
MLVKVRRVSGLETAPMKSYMYMSNTGAVIEKAATFEFIKWITDTDQANECNLQQF